MLKNLSTKTRWAIGAASALVLLVVCAIIVYAANYSGRVLPGTTVAVLRGRDGEGFLIGSDDDLGVFHFRGQGGIHGRGELLDGVLADGGHGFQGAAGEEGTDEGR